MYGELEWSHEVCESGKGDATSAGASTVSEAESNTSGNNLETRRRIKYEGTKCEGYST